MVDENIKKRAIKIEREVNVMGGTDEIGYLLSKMHPTLQQDFMRIAVSFIMHMSESSMVDARNEKTHEVCKKLSEVLDDDVITNEDRPESVKHCFAAPTI